MKKILVLSLLWIATVTIVRAEAKDLFTAARTNDVMLAAALIDSGADINQQDDKGYTPLILATYDGSYEVAQLLLKHHADTEKKDRSGRTALMGVAFKGDEKEAQLLLSNGARADAKDAKGLTSMMYAVMFGRLSVIKVLRENKISG